MDKETFKTFVRKIDGLCYEEICFLLYSLVKSLSHIYADILEIGAYKGRVSVSLALAVKENNMQAKVFSLDINYFNTKKEFINNIERFNLEDVIIPIFKPSSLASIGWRRPLKFIFIDTDGNYFSAKCDFILWERFLLKGGIIALSCADSPPIKRFFNEYIKRSDRFNKFKDTGAIIFAYKEKESAVYFLKIFYIIITYTIYSLLKIIYYQLRDKRVFCFLKSSLFRKIINLLKKLL
ncbi:MAG: class I SAM-dependent methyltransferase [Candidatus Omnitrophica bacterium]|nr:class I SAM-dependent methyltransferase [Candidatus Omnitrophota bacterium]